MHRTTAFAVAAATIALAAGGAAYLSQATAQDESAAPHTRSLADADAFVRETEAWIEAALARFEIVPGLAVAVVVGDEAVLVQGWGTADRENDVPSTAATDYYIASATKPHTALAAAILDARGEIELVIASR